jgi:hypothetical protein
MEFTMTTVNPRAIDQNLPMPSLGQTVSHTFPQGDVVSVKRTSQDTRDLAATSARFSVHVNGEMMGVITAIGGLCGGFEDCYYPHLRDILEGVVQAH